MADTLNQEKLQKIQEVVTDINELYLTKKYDVVDFLNALSMFSISVAVKLNLNKETYLNDLSIMFDENKVKIESEKKENNNE
jgi:hypothetical protein